MTDLLSELLILLEESRELGFLGPGPVAAQLSHSECFLPALDRGQRILDLGSGGGLPGLVLAVALPESSFLLLDSNLRKCAFLESAIERLGVGNRVQVLTGRAELLARDAALRGSCDAVVARSFGPPAVTAECALGFMSGPGSILVISEPPESHADRWPALGLELLGLELGKRETHGQGTIQQLQMITALKEKYPRRVGIPAKRPIF